MTSKWYNPHCAHHSDNAIAKSIPLNNVLHKQNLMDPSIIYIHVWYLFIRFIISRNSFGDKYTCRETRH